jgi:protein SCO1/2
VNKTLKVALLAVLIAVLVLALGWVLFVWEPDPEPAPIHEALGLASRPTGGDFTLQSAKGPVVLADLRGDVVLIYFGYTWCPDICPTNLGFITMALEQLSPEELSRTRVLFISVDPERDTVERLQEYGAYFHPNIVGITGSDADVAAAAKLYGASYQRTEQDSATGYVVDHSAFTYVVAPDGHLAETLGHATPPQQIVAVIRGLLSNRSITSEDSKHE